MTRTSKADALTRNEAAYLLGISLSRLAQLRQAGEIRQYRVVGTRAVYFLRGEVEALRDRRAKVVAE